VMLAVRMVTDVPNLKYSVKASWTALLVGE
jgi:hypothetical protein